MIDSVFRRGESYYPQLFFEKWKYIFKEKDSEYIGHNIKILSASDRRDSDKKISNEENSAENNSDEEYSDEKINEESFDQKI